MNYSIGIIDDDSTKVTQLLTYLDLGWEDEDGNLLKKKYEGVTLCPLEIKLESTEAEMVQKVYDIKPDALIIDYKLSSQQNIAYTGVSLASAIDAKLHDFPIFILTSFQDDVFSKECFDVYQVFDFERYIVDERERLEINSKIVEQIRKYNRTILQWKKELTQLLPLRGSKVSVDDRILELDTWIENSIDGTSALSPKMKRDLNGNHIQTLIAKIDSIINEG